MRFYHLINASSSLYHISKFHVGAEHLRAAALRGGPRRGGEGAGGRVPPGGGEGGDGMGLCVGGGRWRVEEEGEAAGSFEKVPPEDLHREVRLGGSPSALSRRG